MDDDTEERGPEDEKEGSASKSPYAPGNIREDGSYKVGRGRPPEHTQFRKDDGRKRGRRPKGQSNFDADLEEEACRRMTLRENGKERRVTKQKASIIRTFDSSISKGNNGASILLWNHLSRLAEKSQPTGSLPQPDDEELDAWLLDRLAALDATELAHLEDDSSTAAEDGDGE